FVQRFKTEAKRPVMHRDQSPGAKLEKGLHSLFRIHVNFPACWRFVSSNGKQSNLDSVASTDFFEAGKVRAIAAVKNGAAIRRNDESTEVAMQICQKSRSPVVTRRERNF